MGNAKSKKRKWVVKLGINQVWPPELENEQLFKEADQATEQSVKWLNEFEPIDW